jgi:hypothetical protein
LALGLFGLVSQKGWREETASDLSQFLGAWKMNVHETNRSNMLKPRGRARGGVEAEPKLQPGLSIELAEATKSWLLFDIECGGFFNAADLRQTLIEKAFHNLE